MQSKGVVSRARHRMPVSRQEYERISGRLDKQAGQIKRLRARVTELEAEMQEARRLNKRLAEVMDVVSEVLIPEVLISEAYRDDERIRQAIERYAKTL